MYEFVAGPGLTLTGQSNLFTTLDIDSTVVSAPSKGPQPPVYSGCKRWHHSLNTDCEAGYRSACLWGSGVTRVACITLRV